MTARLKVVPTAVRHASLAAETGTGTGTSMALENSLGFMVCDTARYVKRVLYARLAPYGIPGSCWFVLRALWQRDGVSQRELSAMLGLAEPTLMVALRTMERLGLVIRVRDTVDKRRIAILLTPKGRDMKEELLGLAEEINGLMLAKISEQERSVMMSSLRAVHAELARACDGVLQPIDEAVTDAPTAARTSRKKRVPE